MVAPGRSKPVGDVGPELPPGTCMGRGRSPASGFVPGWKKRKACLFLSAFHPGEPGTELQRSGFPLHAPTGDSATRLPRLTNISLRAQVLSPRPGRTSAVEGGWPAGWPALGQQEGKMATRGVRLRGRWWAAGSRATPLGGWADQQPWTLRSPKPAESQAGGSAVRVGAAVYPRHRRRKEKKIKILPPLELHFTRLGIFFPIKWGW